MALQIATVADAISKLSVSGLVIKDLNEIPTHGSDNAAILTPLPNFVTEFSVTRDSFGGASAKMTANYTLNYRLLYGPVGAERSSKLILVNGMVAKVALFWDAVLAIGVFSGCVDIEPAGIANMGPVLDYSGVEFWGCDVSLRVMEFVN